MGILSVPQKSHGGSICMMLLSFGTLEVTFQAHKK